MAFYYLKEIENIFVKKNITPCPYPQLAKFTEPPLLPKVDVQNKSRPNLIKFSCSANFIHFPRKYPLEDPGGLKLC